MRDAVVKRVQQCGGGVLIGGATITFNHLVLLGGAGACLPFLLVARRSWTTVERADRMPGPGRTSLDRLGLLPSSTVLCLFLVRLWKNKGRKD